MSDEVELKDTTMVVYPSLPEINSDKQQKSAK